jgi:hypothetical protein
MPDPISNSAVPSRPLSTAPTALRLPQRPASAPPTVALPQQVLAATTTPVTPHQAGPVTIEFNEQESTATSTRFSHGWLLINSTWQNVVAIVAVIGFATAIYYASRGDDTSAQGLQYTSKSWFLSTWTAKMDYCEFKRIYTVSKAARDMTEVSRLIGFNRATQSATQDPLQSGGKQCS